MIPNKFYVMAKDVDFSVLCKETNTFYSSNDFIDIRELQENIGQELLEEELERNPNYEGTVDNKKRGLTLVLFKPLQMLADAEEKGEESDFVKANLVELFELDTESWDEDLDN